MRMRPILLLLLMSFIITGCATNVVIQETPESNEGTDSVEDNATELIWWVYTPSGDIPDDVEEVLERANEISRKDRCYS